MQAPCRAEPGEAAAREQALLVLSLQVPRQRAAVLSESIRAQASQDEPDLCREPSMVGQRSVPLPLDELA